MSKTRTAHQFWVRAPGEGEIRAADLAPPGRDDVLVRALYSGVSRGTESLVFRGEVPPSQREAMRAPFQEGDFPAPVKYGYASVGEVLEGSGPTGLGLVGRTVFCLYPHQDLYRVPADRVAPLPEGLPAARAVLAANMETALNALWDARATAGDRIAVVGAGVVGLLVAHLCDRLPGAQVRVVDPAPERAHVARTLGLALFDAPPRGLDADLVFHASGTAAGLAEALDLAGDDATVVEVSWYGSRPVTVPLGEAFHSRRLTVRSSQVGRLPPERRPRWNHARRLALALALLRDERLDALIDGESDFASLPRVMAELSRASGALCHRVRYETP